MNNKSTLTPEELVRFFMSKEKRADLNKTDSADETPNGLMQEDITVEPLEEEENEDTFDFLKRMLVRSSEKVTESKEELGEQLAAIKEKALADIDIIKNTQLKSKPNPFIGGPLSPMLTEAGVEQEVEKFVDPMLRDPDLLEIPTETFDETDKQTEEALTDAEIADIVSSADDDTVGEAQDNQPNVDDGKGLGSRYRELEPLGDKFIERYAKVPNVDFEFIKQKEGFKTSMYVPKNKSGQALGKSGATIASGFDLGQRNENDLTGLPPSLINKLKPYLGKKKKAAVKFVKDNPLSITEAEANIINAFAKEQEMNRLKKAWNSSSDVKWEDLSVPQATAVASVHFQYGNLPAKTPKFWRYTTTGDWAAARDELDNFGDDYSTRRKSEADYLEQDNAAILGTKAS